jgi:hypothetical protein
MQRGPGLPRQQLLYHHICGAPRVGQCRTCYGQRVPGAADQQICRHRLLLAPGQRGEAARRAAAWWGTAMERLHSWAHEGGPRVAAASRAVTDPAGRREMHSSSQLTAPPSCCRSQINDLLGNSGGVSGSSTQQDPVVLGGTTDAELAAGQATQQQQGQPLAGEAAQTASPPPPADGAAPAEGTAR